MKIVCDNCATKYSIADEKVRGKVFKIRCKKCSHIIVVRGGADGNVEASRDAGPAADAGFPGEDQQTIAARGGTPAAGVPAAGGGAGDAVWHLVIDREQVGPLAPAEVRQKFSNGEIDVETYAWREGFGDWLRLGSIEDFRDLGAGAPARDEGATRRTDSADLFAGAGGSDDSGGMDQPAADLFGGGAAAAAAAPAYSSAPAPAAAEADVFGGGGGGGLFGAPSAAPARAARTSSPGFAASAAPAPATQNLDGSGVDVRPMTGQRNENSVLFSLNNLQALATGGGGAKSSAPEPRPGFANSQTEGSGLIDIRAMAASTLAASPSTSSGPSGSKDDLPGLGAAPVFSPMAAPILMPAAPSGPPKWMWAILGVGVLAVLGIVVVGILLLTRKPAEPTVAALPPGTAAAPGTPAAHAPAAAAAGAPAATAPAAAGAPATATPPAAVAQKDEKAAEDKK
ncbi:MAG TPA: GYF domain-containing protein, partial [Polyangia bacterium]